MTDEERRLIRIEAFQEARHAILHLEIRERNSGHQDHKDGELIATTMTNYIVTMLCRKRGSEGLFDVPSDVMEIGAHSKEEALEMARTWLWNHGFEPGPGYEIRPNFQVIESGK